MSKIARWFGSLGILDVLSSILERAITWRYALITIFGSGAVGSAVGYFTDALKPYAPFSWLLAFLVTAILFSLVLLIFGLVRERRQRGDYYEFLSSTPLSINPLDTTFQSKRIQLTDLYSPFDAPHINKTFINCELVGPGLVHFPQCQLEVREIVNCNFVEVVKGVQLRNAVVFRHCAFRNLSLFGLTVLLTPDDADEFRKVHPDANWLTPLKTKQSGAKRGSRKKPTRRKSS